MNTFVIVTVVLLALFTYVVTDAKLVCHKETISDSTKTDSQYSITCTLSKRG